MTLRRGGVAAADRVTSTEIGQARARVVKAGVGKGVRRVVAAVVTAAPGIGADAAPEGVGAGAGAEITTDPIAPMGTDQGAAQEETVGVTVELRQGTDGLGQRTDRTEPEGEDEVGHDALPALTDQETTEVVARGSG